jgi:hypothetical protein
MPTNAMPSKSFGSMMRAIALAIDLESRSVCQCADDEHRQASRVPLDDRTEPLEGRQREHQQGEARCQRPVGQRRLGEMRMLAVDARHQPETASGGR